MPVFLHGMAASQNARVFRESYFGERMPEDEFFVRTFEFIVASDAGAGRLRETQASGVGSQEPTLEIADKAAPQQLEACRVGRSVRNT